MPSEVKSSPNDRMAEVEAEVARVSRQLNEERLRGKRVESLPVRFARTQGENPENPTDLSYPDQVYEKGCRLPIVFCDVEYDDEADDPVILIPRSLKPQAWLYSPFGWIPRLVDLQIFRQNGMYVVHYMPEIEVVVSQDGDIQPGERGEVTVVKHGAANGQTFNAYLDHMDSDLPAENGEEGVVNLREGRKVLALSNLEC